MSSTAAFTGSIPETYDRDMGPVIFVDYAAEMAARAASLNPKNLLETAAGTGIVTRALRDRLPKDVPITATDLNDPMLDIARRKFRDGEAVTFQPADAQDLPFGDGAFDVAVCQFGIMFYPDKEKSFREIHRVLKPGGRYLFSVWDSHAHNPYAALTDSVVRGLFPSDPPRFFQVPFSCAPIDPLKEMLIAAGFGDIVVSVMRLTKVIPDVDAFAHGLIYGNPLQVEIRERAGLNPDEAVARIADGLRREFGPGAKMPLQTLFYSATSVPKDG